MLGTSGGKLEDSKLIPGIAIDKPMSHPQMPKSVENPKIAILTCPFEAPKIKTKYHVDIKSSEDFKSLYEQEQKYFRDQVKRLKDAGTVHLISYSFLDSRTFSMGI